MSEGKQIQRSVFFISDGTAITAETLGHSLLSLILALKKRP